MSTSSHRFTGAVFVIPIAALGAFVAATWLDLFVNPAGPGEAAHWSDALWSAAFLGFPIVGAIIVSRLTRNAIGWVLCGIGVGISVAMFAAEYAQFALVTRPGSIPLGSFFAWLVSWTHFVAIACLIMLVIVFPGGAARNAFWRWTQRAMLAVVAFSAFLYATRAGPLDSLREVDNPGGIPALKGIADPSLPILGLLLVLIFVAAIGDKVWVFARSSGIERQQIKWFALSALMFPILFALTIIFEENMGRGSMGEFDPVVLAFFFGFNGMAAGIGFAVFKHRLYEIDLVINRALVYGGLTAILAASYIGLVFGFQALLAPVTADSDLAIAASTLAVAALFRPVRSRFQAFIDRRFYRRKFDAERTLEEFSVRLRDEVDLGSLSAQLANVVSDTMQPAHVSLWLRDAP